MRLGQRSGRRGLAAAVFILCVCGTALTLYVVHVQQSKLEDDSYKALCDLDDSIACSEYLAADKGMQELVEWLANLVGVTYNPSFNPHNPLARISFFPTVCLLGCLPFTPAYFLATLLTSISSMISAYLLYELFYVVNQICLPCLAIYFLHLLLFLVLTMRWAGASSGSKQQARPSATPSKQKDSEEKPKEKESSDEGSKKQKEKDSTEGKEPNAKKRKKKQQHKK